jgi:hypothetical protein
MESEIHRVDSGRDELSGQIPPSIDLDHFEAASRKARGHGPATSERHLALGRESSHEHANSVKVHGASLL